MLTREDVWASMEVSCTDLAVQMSRFALRSSSDRPCSFVTSASSLFSDSVRRTIRGLDASLRMEKSAKFTVPEKFFCFQLTRCFRKSTAPATSPMTGGRRSDPTSIDTAGSSRTAANAQVVSKRTSLVRKTAPTDGSEQPRGMSRWSSADGITNLESVQKPCTNIKSSSVSSQRFQRSLELPEQRPWRFSRTERRHGKQQFLDVRG